MQTAVGMASSETQALRAEEEPAEAGSPPPKVCHAMLRSNCWVYANGIADVSISEKYSWAVLKAWSETVAAGTPSKACHAHMQGVRMPLCSLPLGRTQQLSVRRRQPCMFRARACLAGYGQQGPVTTSDCWLTTASLFCGMCIWTFLGGIVTTLLIHLNAASSEYTAKITALNQYMAHRRLPQARVAPTLALLCSVPTAGCRSRKGQRVQLYCPGSLQLPLFDKRYRPCRPSRPTKV